MLQIAYFNALEDKVKFKLDNSIETLVILCYYGFYKCLTNR